MSRPAASPRFDGDADFDARVLPALRAQPFFREPSESEVARSFAAYRDGSAAGLIDTWRAVAEPTRASLGAIYGAMFRNFHRLPRRVNALSYLATLRAVLAAGVRFRARLRPETQAALSSEFPWLEHRHAHVPDGYTPRFEFPSTFERFIDGGELDDARARWQLAAALNEVQQTVFTDHLAGLYRIPELRVHAARERDSAISYFAHRSPDVTEGLWRQCIYHLDALNAAVFHMTSVIEGPRLLARAWFSGDGEWRAFVDGLARPQWLMPLP